MNMTQITNFSGMRAKIITKVFSLLVIVVGLVSYLWIALSYVNKKACMKTSSFVFVSIFWCILFMLILVRVSKPYKCIKKERYLNWIYTAVIPLLSIYMEEEIWNPSYKELSRTNFFLNYLLILSITIGLLFVIQKSWFVYLLVIFLGWIYGMINYYVLKFKGCPPLYNDIVASGTALTVISQYSYWVSDSIIYGMFILMCAIVCIIYFMPTDLIILGGKRKKAIIRFGGFCGLSAFLILVYSINLQSILGIEINGWMPVNSFYSNGAPITMIVSAQNAKMKKPENYRKTKVREILDRYEIKEQSQINENPTIIVIMNESFADLSVLGDFGSDEYLANFYGMESYVLRGNTYVSVCGGGTCNSEFEFLTGSSMSNVSMGIYPYQAYNLSEAFSLSDLLSDYGYETIAIHPFTATNWNRVQVYDWFGFSRYISDSEMTDIRTISWAISDEYNYEQIIYLYENRSDPLFIFNVTMQNHGGYEVPLKDDIIPVSIEKRYNIYSDVINYLTLIRESDKAFAGLLEYFSCKDDPVIICMFGDHQPTLDDEFITSFEGDNSISGIQKRYMTPYVIWSNYDLDVSNVYKDMSLNYLGANLLNILGIHTDYIDFLLDLERDIPIINSVGYQTSDGEWHKLSEETSRLNDYKLVQYYELFEDDAK